MVYSTCSLNPIEDEAVVLALLREGNGALQLEDPRPRLPGLKVRDGLHNWRVIDSESRLGGQMPPKPQGEKGGAKEGAEEKEAEAEEVEWTEENAGERLRALGLREISSYAGVPEGYQRLFRATHFPPADPAEARRLNLQYCMRCLPHDQDTGGFFVALLRKVAPFGGPKPGSQQPQAQAQAQPEAAAAAATTPAATPAPAEVKEAAVAVATPDAVAAGAKEADKGKGKGGGGGKKGGQGERFSAFAPKEFFTPLAEEAWAGIRAFYGVTEAFPRDRLFCRGDTAKVVSYMSKGLVQDVQLSHDSHLQVGCF